MSGREESTPLPASSRGGKGDKKGDPKTTTPQTGSKKHPGIELTAVESLLFFNIVRFNKDPGAVDWHRVALHSNLKNAASAKVRFRQIQRKYHMDIGTPSSGTGGNSNRKRKPTGEEHDDNGDDNASDETPVKKARPRKRAAPDTGTGKKTAKKSTMKEVDKEKEQEPDEYDEEEEEEEEEEYGEEEDEYGQEDGGDMVSQSQSPSRQRTANPEITLRDDPFFKQDPSFQHTSFNPYNRSGDHFDGFSAQQYRPEHLSFALQPSHGMDQLRQHHQHYPMTQGMGFLPQNQQQQPPLTNVALQTRANLTPEQISSLRLQQLRLHQYQQRQRQQSASFTDPFLGFHTGLQIIAAPHDQGQATQTPSLDPRHVSQGRPQPQPEQDGALAGQTGSPAGSASPTEVTAGAADDAAADHEEQEQQEEDMVANVKHED